jgi:hypothetical protein
VAATHAALTVHASVQTYYRRSNRRTQVFGLFAPVEMGESTDARNPPTSVENDKQTDARNLLAKLKTFSFMPGVVGEIYFLDQTLDLPCLDNLLGLLLGDLG